MNDVVLIRGDFNLPLLNCCREDDVGNNMIASKCNVATFDMAISRFLDLGLYQVNDVTNEKGRI